MTTLKQAQANFKFRSFPALLGFLFVFGFFVFWRLGFPAVPYFDEVYHVPSARNLLNLSAYSDLAHPPFGKLLMAWSISLFGDHSWVWRFPSAVFGMGTLIVLFLLTARLTASRNIALLTTVLIGLDGMHLVQSRAAMLNTTMFFFMWLSLLLLIYNHQRAKGPVRWLYILSGLSIGLAVSTRIVAAMMLPILAITHAQMFCRRTGRWPLDLRLLLEIALYWGLLPLAVYEAAWFLVIPQIENKTLIDGWRSQNIMVNYHVHLKAGHNSGSAWWSWPFMIEPAWFDFRMFGKYTVAGVIALGNPAVYWMTLPAMFYSFFLYIKRHDLLHGSLLVGFLLLWLPCSFMHRVQFLHYYETAVPFVLISMALLLRDLWRQGPAGRLAVTFYFCVVVILFVYWLPLWTDLPIPHPYYRHHMWFKGWV